LSTRFYGKILYIDLTTGEFTEKPIPMKVYEEILGGMGLANWLAADYAANDRIEALSSDNPLIFAAGTLAGTPAPSSSRTTAVTRMPLNDAWGNANGGGNFAATLRWAGYDALVITGRSDKPVYLMIGMDNSIDDAGDLWGKGIKSTTERLWSRHKDSSVMAIGPAGERMVYFALSMLDNVATLGRGGLGAVMGSKNLKAVVVKGHSIPPLVDKGKFLSLSKQLQQDMRNIPWRNQWLKQGIFLGWPIWKQGLIKENFQRQLSDEEAENLGPRAYEEHFIRPLACISCPLADKALVAVDGCSYPISYGLHASLSGSRWGARDEGEALKAMIMANDYGVDDLTLYAVIGWSIDLYLNGVITNQETGGMVLEHTPHCYHELANQVVERKGFGDILAQGFLANMARWGDEARDLAVHIKGVDPISDPRPHTSGFLYAQLTNPRGAYVVQGNSPAFNPGKNNRSFQRFLTSIGVDENKAVGIAPDDEEADLALLVRHTEDFYAVASSLGFCARQPVMQCYTPAKAAALVTAATGLEFNDKKLLTVGERVWNQYRLNNGQGRPLTDSLPDKFYQPLAAAQGEIKLENYQRTHHLTEAEINQSLKRYYLERGWDASGQPTVRTIERLSLKTHA